VCVCVYILNVKKKKKCVALSHFQSYFCDLRFGEKEVLVD